MAEQVVPSYVVAVTKSGRRFYKREFIKGLVADLKSAKLTVPQAAEQFHINRSIVYGWLRGPRLGGGRSGGGSERQKAARAARVNGAAGTMPKGQGTLLERALKMQGTPDPGTRTDFGREEVELALAYLRGEVDYRTVSKLLPKPRGRKFIEVPGWSSRAVAWGLKHGGLSFAWRKS